MAKAAHPKRRGRRLAHINPDQVRELAGLGMTAEQIASRIGVSRRTLFDRMRREPGLRRAFDEGVAVAIELAARLLWELVIRERKAAALIFWLKVRGGFTVPKEAA